MCQVPITLDENTLDTVSKIVRVTEKRRINHSKIIVQEMSADRTTTCCIWHVTIQGSLWLYTLKLYAQYAYTLDTHTHSKADCQIR